MVVNALKQWRLSTGDQGLVFATRSGKPHALTNLRRLVWLPLLKAAGCPAYHFHSLRHACASLLIEQGWQVKRIQDYMGHSDAAMTLDTYGHLFPAQDLAGDMARLQAAIVVAAA